MRHALGLGVYPLVFCLTASCGGGGPNPGSSDATPVATPDATQSSFSVGLVVNALNYSLPPQLAAPALIATNTNNGAPDGAPSMGILSGPPTAMRVYLQSIALEQEGAMPTVIYSSTATHTTDSGIAVTGCQLSLVSGNLDLSVCPGLESLSIPAGSFTRTTMTFAEVGEIQGCLNATFANVTTSTPTAGTYTYAPPYPQTPIAYTTDAVTPATPYTFCTRKDKHYYQAETASQTTIGSDADFDVTNAYFSGLSTPDFVTIDLISGNQNALTMAQLEVRSVTLSSTTVPTSATPTLTIAVDMNRIFEFFANVRSDFNPPNPMGHTGTSYFFTTKFVPVGSANATAAVTVHAGAITVQGYQWTATPTAGGAAAAAGWYTLFLDGSGNYLGGTMYEDDDNELTILKGNAAITSGTLATGATLTMDIAGTCTGFTTTALDGTGSCALSIANSQTYDVAYTRLL